MVQRPRQSDQLVAVNNARRVIEDFVEKKKKLFSNVKQNILFFFLARSTQWTMLNAVNYVFVQIH